MSTPHEDPHDTGRPKVDTQDGGPGSHTEDQSGGQTNDAASGGISERQNEDDTQSKDPDGQHDRPDHDVHGDIDTVG